MSAEVNMEQLDAAAEWLDLIEWQGEAWEDGKAPWLRGDAPDGSGS